jgi:hypothetical protein
MAQAFEDGLGLRNPIASNRIEASGGEHLYLSRFEVERGGALG